VGHATLVPSPGAESQWLLPTFARVLAATGYLLFWVSIGLAWPMAGVGTAFQLLGILITLLGLPVVSEWLGAVETWVLRPFELIGALFSGIGQLFRSIRDLLKPVGDAMARAAEARPEIERVDRATVTERAWLEHLDDALFALAHRVDRLEREGDQVRAEFTERLRQQGVDLRAHTLAATRQGWQFIFWGLVCSGFGTALALVA
jgi:hypothetical protein